VYLNFPLFGGDGEDEAAPAAGGSGAARIRSLRTWDECIQAAQAPSMSQKGGNLSDGT